MRKSRERCGSFVLTLVSSAIPEAQQIEAAAEAMLQLAQLYSLRSEVLIGNWKNSYREPHIANSFLANIVRQTIAVDLSNLLPPATPSAFRCSKPIFKGEPSVVVVIDKSAVLALLEQLEAEFPPASETLPDE